MYSCIHLFIYSFIHVFIYSCIHLFMYSFIHVFIYSCIHLFIYSCIHLFIQLRWHFTKTQYLPCSFQCVGYKASWLTVNLYQRQRHAGMTILIVGCISCRNVAIIIVLSSVALLHSKLRRQTTSAVCIALLAHPAVLS